MIAIDNAQLIDPSTGIGIPPVNEALFVPGASFAYDSGAETLTVTDTSVATGPDAYKSSNVTVNDNQGGTAFGNIAASGGNTGAIDVSRLDLTGPLVVKITQVSELGVQATGEAGWINASNDAGNVGSWEIDYSTNVG